MSDWSKNPENPALTVEPREADELVENGQVAVDNVLPLETETVADAAERTDNPDELRILGQEKKENYAGDGILESQEQTQEFSHVSKSWQGQCITFEQGMEVLAQQQLHIQDIKCPLNKWKPVVTPQGRFALRYLPTGREYIPTEHAMGHLMSVVPKDKGSSYLGSKLLNEKADHPTKEGEFIFERDKRDAQVLCDMVNLFVFQPDRVDQDKTRLFRTWDDGTLRAVLSKDYTVVNNQWMLETVASLIPGGLLSHWKGDADTIYGNVLIPDTIRSEADSDYGGMLSIGNSEIGARRILSVPSVFRAICMNGCIWDQEIGKGINKVHRQKDGKINLDELRENLKTNLEKQIPMIDDGLRLVLEKRDMGFGTATPLQVLASVATDLKLSKKQGAGMVQAYRVEAGLLDSKMAQTAFAVLNAVTRFGQTQSNLQWFKMDCYAGNIANMSRDKWGKVVKRAATLDEKDIAKRLGEVSV